MDGLRPASEPASFLDDVLAGRAPVGSVDDYIERWHDLSQEAPGADLPLHQHLGLTWDEYGRWLQRPSALQEIIDAHR